MQATNVVNLPGRDSYGVEHGTVIGGGQNGFVVQGTAGTFAATVAFSCLIRPSAGDKVLYTRDTGGTCFILSILSRPSSPNAVMSFPGDVAVEAAKGRVLIAGAEGIDLSTTSAVSMLAEDLNVAAESAKYTVKDIQVSGDTVTGSVTTVRLFSDAIDTVAKRVTQRAKTCFRWVEQIEHVTAGQMLHSVRNLFTIRARKSAIKAKDDVKIDGKRVHLG